MKFSVIHPTARVTSQFEHPWWRTALSVLVACERPHEVEYIVVVHESRIVDFYDEVRDSNVRLGSFGRVTFVTNYGRDCLVDQCNAGQLAATGEIQCWNQDDMRYPEHWDTEISKLIPDTSQLVCLQARTDGTRRDLLTLPTIATKRLTDAIGALSPEYESMFSDVEWSERARMLGKVIQAPSLYFQHLHPAYGLGQMDAIYELENSSEAYSEGRKVLERRRALGFPRVPLAGETSETRQAGVTAAVIAGANRALDWLERALGVNPDGTKTLDTEIPSYLAPRCITFCLPGETFRFEWLSGLIDLCNHLGAAGWQIKICLGYSTSCYTTRINLSQEVIDAAQSIRPEYVFWLDDDNIVKPAAFLKLLAFLDGNPDADVVTGWCWIRQKDRWGISVGQKFFADGVHLMPIELSALFEGGDTPKRIAHTGFPCVLMRYEVLEKLGANAFMPILRADLPNWFAGEDVAFSIRAQESGIKMWVDPSCKVAHLKTISQEPDIQLYQDTPKELKDWRQQVNGPAITVPENFHEVIS